MSRMFHAPLRAATLCAAILFGIEHAFAQITDPYDPDAEVHLGVDEYQRLLDRLERLEARDRQWRPQSRAIGRTQFVPGAQDPDQPDQTDLPDQQDQMQRDARQDYGTETGPRTAETRMEAQFEQAAGKKVYPTVEVHGAVQMDNGYFDQNQNNIATLKRIQAPNVTDPVLATGILYNGSDFRRTRLSANGSLTENMNYFVQMDFSFPGRPTFTDVWMEVTQLPLLGYVRAGQWKMPFSLEVVSSFRYTTFPERSVLFQAFDPFRHIGIGFYNYTEDEMMTWAAAAYRAGQDQFGDALSYGNTGNYAGVGRITRLLWYEDEGSRYLHVGGGYNYTAPQATVVTGATTGLRQANFGTVPEYFIGQNTITTLGQAGISQPLNQIDGTPRFVSTGNQAVNHYNLGGLELLWVEGPLSLQTEGMLLNASRYTNGPAGGKGMNFGGGYITVGYFLTGEHRPYIKKSGAIDRIKVLHPFTRSNLDNGCDDCCGIGAWELAARWSYIDLNSPNLVNTTAPGTPVAGAGRLYDFTAGLNWYLNSYAKVQFNYIRADLDNAALGKSLANIYGLRAQFDF
jgi:phosphate-selective porin OprO/OprP